MPSAFTVWTSFSQIGSNGGSDSAPEFAAPGVKLDEANISAALSTLPNWQRDGQIIRRAFEFVDFVAAMKFVNAVAGVAESAQHHPDVAIHWNKVTLAFTTHDAGGLTAKDLALARAL
mgnify:CR=1 FL=1